MKKMFIFLSVLITLIFLTIYLLYINKTFFKDIYNSKAYAKINIVIPKYSYFIDDCCDSVATFKNVSAIDDINKYINKYLETLEIVKCHDKNVYYDSKQDLVIFEYYVKKGFIFNDITINYNYGLNTNCSQKKN